MHQNSRAPNRYFNDPACYTSYKNSAGTEGIGRGAISTGHDRRTFYSPEVGFALTKGGDMDGDRMARVTGRLVWEGDRTTGIAPSGTEREALLGGVWHGKYVNKN